MSYYWGRIIIKGNYKRRIDKQKLIIISFCVLGFVGGLGLSAFYIFPVYELIDNNILEQTEKECFDEIVKVFGGYKGRFHNFWLPKMVNGLTEMREYNYNEVQYAYKMLEKKGNRYTK